MRILLLNILVFFTLITFGQQKVWVGDTNYWYNYQKHINNKIGLDDLSNSNYPHAIRITSLNIITDIWTVDGKNFTGNQIFFTSTSEEKPEYFYRSEIIVNDTAQMIKKLIDDFKIFNIPPQDSIKDWVNGFDGSIYLIENVTTTIYSFKSYWTPEYFPSIPEAVQISTFVQKIEDLLKQQKKFDNFIKSLPKDTSYRYGNSWTKIWINGKTKKRN